MSISVISTLTIGQICDRKLDLFMSPKDVDMVARNARNKAINKFAEELINRCGEVSYNTSVDDIPNVDILTLDTVIDVIKEVAEQMKEENTNG